MDTPVAGRWRLGEEREARHLGAGVLDDERGLEDMEDGDEEETEDEHDAPRSPLWWRHVSGNDVHVIYAP